MMTHLPAGFVIHSFVKLAAFQWEDHIRGTEKNHAGIERDIAQAQARSIKKNDPERDRHTPNDHQGDGATGRYTWLVSD